MTPRFYIDPATELPHIYAHGVSEAEVMEVLRNPLENRPGENGARVLLGRSRAGRALRVIASFDDDRQGVFIITAYDLKGNALKALRRRMKRRGRQ